MEKLDARRSYIILGLKPGATQAQIKEGYRKLAKQWHPDRHANNPNLHADAHEKLTSINAAYVFLKAYTFSSDHYSPQSEQATRADKNKQEAQEAEWRKQEAERQRQKVQQAETERRRQQAERWQQAQRGKREAEQRKQEAEQRKEEAKQQEKERGKRVAEQLRLKAEQPERERQERQERWKREHEENLRIQSENEQMQKEKEEKSAYERERLAQTPKQVKPRSHYFLEGKCLRCGRTRKTLNPGSQCL